MPQDIQDKILRLTLFLIVIIAITHITSLYFYFYFDFWWLDIVMHFLGGFWVVSFSLWLLFFVFKKEISGFFFIILISIIFNLLISFFWEVFEFKLGIATISSNYWPDTISDSLSSLSGGLLAALYFNNQLKKEDHHDGE